MEYHVTSIPKEYSHDTIGSFNWLTRSMDDFQLLGSTSRNISRSKSRSTTDNSSTSRSTADDTLPTQDDGTDNSYNAPTPADETDNSYNAMTPVDDGHETRWEWLFSCWRPSLVNKTDDLTYQSSYNDDGSGESSQPSLSRIDQVLKVPLMVDEISEAISDVTSVPSIDDSDSDSENVSYSGD